MSASGQIRQNKIHSNASVDDRCEGNYRDPVGMARIVECLPEMLDRRENQHNLFANEKVDECEWRRSV